MIRWKTLLASSVFLASVPAVRAADELGVDLELSPGGRWLAVLFESFADVGGSNEKTGQWLFRVDLTAEKPAADLLERQTDLKIGSDAPTHDDVAIVDDGSVLALRTEAPQLVRWNAKLERTENRLFPDDRGFVEMHVHADGKELLIFRQLYEGIDAYRYDLSSGAIRRWPALDGLMDDDIQWSRDLKHVFAVERMSKHGERDAYRLVRVDATTGERKTLAEHVWSQQNCFGDAWLAWSAPCEGHSKREKHTHPFLKVSTSEPFEVVEVKELADWWPMVAIDDDRVLCEGDDSAYAIASVTRGRPQTIGLPRGALRHSNLLGAFVIGRESECELRGHDGKLIKKVRFDLEAPVRKAK